MLALAVTTAVMSNQEVRRRYASEAQQLKLNMILKDYSSKCQYLTNDLFC
jgi:hypothetical protein